MSTRYTAVFNAGEIEGIPEIEQPPLADIAEDELIRAIKDAQAAANYMDFHAGLITEKEYTATLNSVLEMKPKEKALER